MKKSKRRAMIGGGAYKKGQRLHLKTTPSGDVVFPGIVTSPKELAEQYQIMLTLKAETQKQLRLAQQITRRLEKRDHLLQLAEQVDASVRSLEDTIGRLHGVLRLLAAFAATTPPFPEHD